MGLGDLGELGDLGIWGFAGLRILGRCAFGLNRLGKNLRVFGFKDFGFQDFGFGLFGVQGQGSMV